MLKRKGTCVYLWLVHVDIWQKPTQDCQAIILQLKKLFLKKNYFKKKGEGGSEASWNSISAVLVTQTLSPRCSVAQSGPTLCNPMNCSPPGSFVQGTLQARIMEWVAISFSRGIF